VTVRQLIDDHERYARMFDLSADSLEKVGMESAADAGRRIAQQHRDWANGMRVDKQEQRELRTQEAMRKRGRA